MTIISRTFYILFALCISTLNILAQDHTGGFRKSPFKYSNDELPFSFGGGPTFGWGERGPVVGLVLEADFYHILIGGRLAQHPMKQGHHSIMGEKSLILGYQYRKSKILANIGAGIGNQIFQCSSGIIGDCYGEKYEKYSSIVGKAEFGYLLNRAICTYISVNFTSCDRQDVFSIMTGIKFGLYRRADD
jgi:hypothetical protein